MLIYLFIFFLIWKFTTEFENRSNVKFQNNEMCDKSLHKLASHIFILFVSIYHNKYYYLLVLIKPGLQGK